MSRAAKPMERDLKQERHAQNGPPIPGSKTQQNASQAQFSSLAEILKDVLTGIGASTDDAGGPVRITGNDPYVASPHRLAAAATAAAGAHAVITAALWRDRGGKGQSIDIDAHDALQSPFGQIERLPSPARLELTPSHYDLGPEPLGASPARWND
jgi:hypothetical protein